MQPLGSGSSLSNLSTVLNSLAVGPTYHYRMAASNMFGVVVGTNQTFNLASLLPVATTLAPGAADLEPYQATFSGIVNPSGLNRQRNWPWRQWWQWRQRGYASDEGAITLRLWRNGWAGKRPTESEPG